MTYWETPQELAPKSTIHLALTLAQNPRPVESRKESLRSFVDLSQAVISLILTALSKSLGLPDDTLRQCMPVDKSSGTIVRLMRYAPSLMEEEKRTGLVPHTDIGSITLLANIIGGLQILPPDSKPEDEQG